jgi:hypothetical protein
MLRRRKAAKRPSSGSSPALELRLPFPPTPDHMSDHAAHLVGVVQRIDNLALDYSVESLQTIDDLLARFHDAGDDPTRMVETLFQFGAYIGEVIVRAKNAAWVLVSPDHPMGAENGWPLVELTNGNLLNPIGKAFKRVENGEVESIPYFVQVLAD